MRTLLRPALSLLVVLTLLTGVVYPLVVTLVGRGLFPRRVGGSLVERGGRVVGSELVGQAFHDPKYLWGRPSATSSPYDAAASSGSNLGPTSPALAQIVTERVRALRAVDPGNADPIPVDLVTASASGLDPHVSPAAARFQAGRIARARGLPTERVAALVERFVEGRDLGVLGEPRVNVLLVNLALDELR